MKNEGALGCVFSGMRNLSVRCVITSFNPGPHPAFRSGRSQGIGHTGKYMPSPSSAMSSGRLFLGRLLASIAHLRFTSICELTMIAPRTKITYHRTVTNLLTGCLTNRDNFMHGSSAKEPRLVSKSKRFSKEKKIPMTTMMLPRKNCMQMPRRTKITILRQRRSKHGMRLASAAFRSKSVKLIWFTQSTTKSPHTHIQASAIEPLAFPMPEMI
jgi:hypothetical protein